MRPRLAAALALALPALAAAAPKQEPWADQLYTDETVRKDPQLNALRKRMESGDIPKVQFDFDKAVVRPESYPSLDMIVDLMLKRPDLKLKVIAHTCSIGTEEYNLKLSQRRAKAVADYLTERGVPPPSIRWRGAGFSEPIADNSTEEGREKNRRVEFRFTRRDWDAIY